MSKIEELKVTILNTPIGHPTLTDHFMDLANAYMAQFRSGSGGVSHLQYALKSFRAAVDATPFNHSGRVYTQYNLAVTYLDCFHRLGDLEYLNYSVKYIKGALKSAPVDNSLIPLLRRALAVIHVDRYNRSNDPADIDVSLSQFKSLTLAMPIGSPELPGLFHDISIALNKRFQSLGDLRDLKSALMYSHAAHNAHPAGDSRQPDIPHNLGTLHRSYFDRQGDVVNLVAAINYGLEAVNALPSGHPDAGNYQRNLGLSYKARYSRLGNHVDIEAAVKYLRKGVELTPLDHPQYSACCHDLGSSYIIRYYDFGDLEDLENAISCIQAAINASGPEQPNYLKHQELKAAAHIARFRQKGIISDLQLALETMTTVVEATVVGHPEYTLLATRQLNLATTYRWHHHTHGGLDSLESAITYAKAAVESTPLEKPDRAGCLQLLARCYVDLYYRFNDLDSLELGETYMRQALKSMPNGHPELPLVYEDMCVVYLSRYYRLEDIADLQTAVDFAQAAVDASPSEHPSMAAHYHMLAVATRDMFLTTNNLDTLLSAIKYAEKAAKLSVDELQNNLKHQYHLGVLHCDLFNKTKEFKDLDLAIEYFETVISKFLNKDHPSLSESWQDLGSAYHTRFKMLGREADYGQALIHLQKAARSLVGRPKSRWFAAQEWANLTQKYDKSSALEAYTAGFSILPDLLWAGIPMADKHNLLAKNKVSEFFASACTTAIISGNLNLAVEYLEQGLAIMHRQLLQLKDATEQLGQLHPDLALELRNLSEELWHKQSALKLTTDDSDLDKANISGQSTNLLALNRKNLLDKIRKLDGFEDFQLPTSYTKLASASLNGPVIMINCATSRVDALIQMPSGALVHVELPQISQSQANIQLKELRLALKMCDIKSRSILAPKTGKGSRMRLNPHKAQRMFKSLLAWLSETLVQPVFNVLQKNGITNGRLWWCPSGPFTYLPIHAAEIESQFIQSYTSTLDALIKARKVFPNMDNTQGHPLLATVGLTTIPNEPSFDLPSVEQELEAIDQIVGNLNISKLLNEQATVSEVLNCMKTSAWIHLACHGEQHESEPLKSGLILHNGKLELQEILDHDFPNAEFAFLSACQTAMGDAKLMNESLHLAGGLIAAGYKGAIGTLWNISDLDGPTMASIIYGKMKNRDGDGLDITLGAEALAEAVKELKAQGAPFHRWIPFIHMGI